MNQQSDDPNFEQTPFPAMRKRDSSSLQGTDVFPSWRGFQANAEASDGELRIFVHLKTADDAAPSAAQVAAYRYLKENEAKVTAALLAGLYKDYPQIREVYGGIEPEFIPEIESAEDFRRLIRPLNVHVISEEKDDCAYIGFECDCLWDEEHGLGVMMHRAEYIGCNDAEAAWNPDLARS